MVQSCELATSSLDGSRYTFVFHDEPDEEVTLSSKDHFYGDLAGDIPSVAGKYGLYEITFHPNIFGDGRVIDDIKFAGYVETDADGVKIDYDKMMEAAEDDISYTAPPTSDSNVVPDKLLEERSPEVENPYAPVVVDYGMADMCR